MPISRDEKNMRARERRSLGLVKKKYRSLGEIKCMKSFSALRDSNASSVDGIGR